jgi:hypothetical protein
MRMCELGTLVATFTAPENIGMDVKSLLWIFPLLASVAIIYKATKMRVIFLRRFFREVVILFCTLSVVMILIAALLHVVVWILTG